MLDLEVCVSTLMQPVSQLFNAVAKYLRKTADEKKWLFQLLASKGQFQFIWLSFRSVERLKFLQLKVVLREESYPVLNRQQAQGWQWGGDGRGKEEQEMTFECKPFSDFLPANRPLHKVIHYECINEVSSLVIQLSLNTTVWGLNLQHTGLQGTLHIQTLCPEKKNSFRLEA